MRCRVWLTGWLDHLTRKDLQALLENYQKGERQAEKLIFPLLLLLSRDAGTSSLPMMISATQGGYNACATGLIKHTLTEITDPLELLDLRESRVSGNLINWKGNCGKSRLIKLIQQNPVLQSIVSLSSVEWLEKKQSEGQLKERLGRKLVHVKQLICPKKLISKRLFNLKAKKLVSILQQLLPGISRPSWMCLRFCLIRRVWLTNYNLITIRRGLNWNFSTLFATLAGAVKLKTPRTAGSSAYIDYRNGWIYKNYHNNCYCASYPSQPASPEEQKKCLI